MQQQLTSGPPRAPPFALQELLNGARASIESTAAGWSRAEKDACINETPATFGWAGSLVRAAGLTECCGGAGAAG